MWTKLIATALTVAGLLAHVPARADETVKQAQQMLTALGYRIGGADGVAGARTHKAMGEAMAAYGQTYDGGIDSVELAFLSRIAPFGVDIDFREKVSEIYILDAADINGDGRADLVLSAMADSEAQLGVPCCEVTAEQIKSIVAAVPQLVYSTPGGYAVTAFPAEARGNRSQSGKFFTTPKGNFFVLGKNGEMGLPDENHGEFSMVFRIDAGDVPAVVTVAEFNTRGVTANVEVADLDGNGWPEIFVNNYGPLSDDPNGSSFLREFGEDQALHRTSLTTAIEQRKAHNFIRIEDIEGDGRLDLLAAGEVWKSLDGRQMISEKPGSYIILDAFGRPASKADRLFLLPPHYGDDHAGFNVVSVRAGGRIFLFEAAMQFLGHQGGGFVFDNLDVYEFSPDDRSITLRTGEVLPEVPRPREDAGGFWIRKADIDFDGVDDVYREKYPRKPQYYSWDGTVFALRDFPSRDYYEPGWVGNQLYLPDAELQCTRLATSPQWLGGRKPVARLQLTRCMASGDLR